MRNERFHKRKPTKSFHCFNISPIRAILTFTHTHFTQQGKRSAKSELANPSRDMFFTNPTYDHSRPSYMEAAGQPGAGEAAYASPSAFAEPADMAHSTSTGSYFDVLPGSTDGQANDEEA